MNIVHDDMFVQNVQSVQPTLALEHTHTNVINWSPNIINLHHLGEKANEEIASCILNAEPLAS